MSLITSLHPPSQSLPFSPLPKRIPRPHHFNREHSYSHFHLVPGRHQGIIGVRTVHLPPYTSEQLVDVLMTRLETLFNDTVHLKQAEKFLPKTSLMLLSEKIAAQVGDVLSLFEVLRSAIDSASKACPEVGLDGSVPIVTPNHIITALKSYPLRPLLPHPPPSVQVLQA